MGGEGTTGIAGGEMSEYGAAGRAEKHQVGRAASEGKALV